MTSVRPHGVRRAVLGLLVAVAFASAPVMALAGQAAPAAGHAPAASAPAPAPTATAAHGDAAAQPAAGQPAAPASAPHDPSAPTVAPAAPAGDTGHAPAAAPVEAGHAQQPAPAEAHGAAQPAAGHAAPAGEHAAAASHGEEHAESPWGLIARLFNFVVLAGALWYFLRGPIAGYLASRSQQIRTELVTAKETTATATRQLAEIDQKLKALPAELAELKKRGAEEIVAEEARIKQTAQSERQRLLEQTRREIDLQVRMAKRDLTDYAATLAVDLASDRIQKTATPDDQQRLIDRYVTQVRSAHD